MQFKDIVGQAEVTTHLADMVSHNRLSHALLFHGREGSGALPMALAFAQFIVCERPQGLSETSNEDRKNAPGLFEMEEVATPITEGPAVLPDSCGKCPACIKAQRYAHPDIHFSFPAIIRDKQRISRDFMNEWREFLSAHPYGNAYDWLQFLKAENKQGNISAEECGDIIRSLSLKSFESEYKILIMWMPEYLGNSGNKLLKLIEEPPPNTLFILVTENESLVLPTISSRCQLVKIPVLTDKDIENALLKNYKATPTQARQIAGISEGNYREAVHLFQQDEEDWHEFMRKWLNAVLKTGPAAQVKWIDEISKLGREKQKQFLRYFNHLLEQSIRLQILGEQGLSGLAEKEMDFAHRLNKLAGISQQQAIIEELDKATYYIERNAHPKILFHALTIKLYHIIRDSKLITTW